jgi:hypothetical protein
MRRGEHSPHLQPLSSFPPVGAMRRCVWTMPSGQRQADAAGGAGFVETEARERLNTNN